MNRIKVHDKEFELFIEGTRLQQVISEMAEKIKAAIRKVRIWRDFRSPQRLKRVKTGDIVKLANVGVVYPTGWIGKPAREGAERVGFKQTKG